LQQIKSGEPIDVFLSSDEERPKQLIHEGLAVPDSFFVYALGRLVLWTNSTLPLSEKNLLKINKLALPEPHNAPYGRAAQQVLEGLHLWKQMQPKIRLVKTTAEAYQETLEKKVDAGFIELSQYLSSVNNLGTHSWIIPKYLHSPISHSAVILKAAKHPTAARAFLKFLRHPAALKVIREFGFRTPNQPEEDD
jgi:molybdate transport system substrate-binding protein